MARATGEDGLLPELIDLPVLGVRESLASAVHHSLRQAITKGILPPGFRLREAALSKRFGVSVTPVREALRRLEREGLVEVSLHRGATVATVGLQEVNDLYEAREVLESRAVRRAAEAHDRDFSYVTMILAEAVNVIDEPDQIQFNQLDVAFHRALNDLGGNAELAELAEQIHHRIQGVRVRCAVHLPGRPTVSHEQHQAILTAVMDRHGAHAESLIRDHVLSVRDTVVGVLSNSDV